MRPNNQTILPKIGVVLAAVVTSWLVFACVAAQVQPQASAVTATVPGAVDATRTGPPASTARGTATPLAVPGTPPAGPTPTGTP
jgi:hypothetical protein